MKKEELIALGIDEEVAKQIMSLNGKDIEATKSKLDKSQEIENLQSQLKEKDQLINESNAQIEKFKTMDIDGIKAQAEEWKNKYSEFETKSKTDAEAFAKQLADQQYDFKLNEYVSGQKFTSDFAKKAYLAELKAQGLKLDADGTILGANEYTEKFKAANQGVFAIEEAPKDPQAPSFDFAAPTSTQTPIKGMTLSEAMKRANAGEKVDFSQIQ